MGKIFGISNNPVSTIDSALQPLRLTPPPAYRVKMSRPKRFVPKSEQVVDRANEANYFIKMRNGFGKLMSHFSKVNKTAQK